MKKIYFPVIEQNEIDFPMERARQQLKSFEIFVAIIDFTMAKSKLTVDLRFENATIWEKLVFEKNKFHLALLNSNLPT